MSNKIINTLTVDFIDSLKKSLLSLENFSFDLKSIDQKNDTSIYGSHIQIAGKMIKLGIVLYSTEKNCLNLINNFLKFQETDGSQKTINLDPYEVLSEILTIASGVFNTKISYMDPTMKISLPINLKDHHLVLSTHHYQVAHFKILDSDFHLCLFSID